MAFSLIQFSGYLKINQHPFVGDAVKLSAATKQAVDAMASCDHNNIVGAFGNPSNRSLYQPNLRKLDVKTLTGSFSGYIKQNISVLNTLSA
jgi:hypothetical protein